MLKYGVFGEESRELLKYHAPFKNVKKGPWRDIGKKALCFGTKSDASKAMFGGKKCNLLFK